MKEDKRLYVVAVAVESPDHRILYAINRGAGMLLSEKKVRGRSGASSLISEKELRQVSVSGDLITFQGNAEVITRKLVGAFASFTRAEECYAFLDVRPRDSRWAAETAEVLELFVPASGERRSFGEKVLAA